MAVYTIYKNGTLIFDGTQKIEPSLHLELNAAGYLQFEDTTIEAIDVTDYKTDTYAVFEGQEQIFSGRPTEGEMNYAGRVQHYIEGAYAYFNDTCVTPFNTDDQYETKTAEQMMAYIVSCHNASAASNRQIQVGVVSGFTQSVVRKYVYESCIEALADLRDECGGYMFMTYTNGVPYLNWYATLPASSAQTVELGKNITDFTKKISVADIMTAIIPIGPVIQQTSDAAQVDDLHVLDTDTQHLYLVGHNLTLTNRTDVNQGLDYLEDSTLVSQLGYHFKKVEFSDAISALDLRVKAYFYLTEQILNMVSYTADVADLHYAAGYELNNEPIKFATMVSCIASVYNPPLNLQLPCSAMDLSLDSAVKTISLGTLERTALSEKLRETNAENSAANDNLQNQIDDMKTDDSAGGGGGGGSGGDGLKLYKLEPSGVALANSVGKATMFSTTISGARTRDLYDVDVQLTQAYGESSVAIPDVDTGTTAKTIVVQIPMTLKISVQGAPLAEPIILHMFANVTISRTGKTDTLQSCVLVLPDTNARWYWTQFAASTINGNWYHYIIQWYTARRNITTAVKLTAIDWQ